MNPLNVPITYLKGAVPPGPIIRANELALYFDAESIVAQAKSEAGALIARAGETLADATREAERIRAQAREAGLTDARTQLEAMRASVIDETVQWCVAENELETTIIARLDTQIRSVVAASLEGFAAEQDPVDRLMQRVRARLRQCAAHERTTLRVANGALEAARVVWARDELGQRLEVVGDPTLKEAQAVIETPFVKIRIDLDLHLQSVLSRLGGAANQ
jgi:flagellar biosynthesis/type III secretory pathway protein FliH